MNLVEQIYEAATNAGLLKECVWRPSDGSPPQHHAVGFVAPDDTVLDGLSLSTEYVMTYPASIFVGLAQREPVEIDGVSFLVRDIRAVGDGSEIRAKLTQL
jgi:hypothetical protein